MMFHLQKIETKNADTVAIVYFDDITKTSICVTIKAFRIHDVSELKPVPIIVYDYYQNCKIVKVTENSRAYLFIFHSSSHHKILSCLKELKLRTGSSKIEVCSRHNKPFHGKAD
jgi:hypothetical protein